MSSDTSTKYRWFILALGITTHILVVGMPYMCMPVLFKEISLDLNLDLVQIGIVWGVISLPSVFCAFFSGMIADKFGASRTIGVACLLAGVVGALRGTSGGFASLTTIMFLLGLVSIPLSSATHKAAGQWFSAKQLGLANGLLAAGMGVGNMLGASVSATLLSPLFGSWRNLMYVYGVVALIVGILWLTAKRSPTSGNASPVLETIPFRQSLSHVVRLKSVWWLGIFMLCLAGYSGGLMGYIPLYLREVGWRAVSADNALALFAGVSIVGAIALSLLSDKLGRRKIILYGSVISVIIAVGLLAIFGSSVAWLSMVLAGLAQETFFALSITVLIETEGVGAAYAGTALGLTGSIGGIGSFFVPPIGNRGSLSSSG
jgi:sugar phosphate permease